ncbi:hypothetical protein PENTCL1PPCAC_6124, partial [Pristionchus entomophagus]
AMTEDGPSKNDTDGAAGAPEAAATGGKTPAVREEASTPADPSPPKLAPEAPTRTPKKEDESEEKTGDGKPSVSSPPEESPPILTQQPPQPQLQSQQATPHAPPQAKPRGRPPGVPNKNNAVNAAMSQQMHVIQNQMKHHLAQQTAAMMHRNGHGPQNMMPQMIQVNTEGQPQFVQIIPGHGPGQFMQPMFQGRARFPVQTQMRPQQRPPQQQLPPGGPNQTVPVLIPLPSGQSGQSSNSIVVSNNALIRHPDGTVYMRPDVMQKQPGLIINHQYTDANGQQAVRQLQLTPAQSAQLQAQMMQKGIGGGIPQHIMLQHHHQQQQQRAANEQMQQQLTRQNLDRLASGAAAAGSSGSRTSDWVGGLPPPTSNGNGAPSLLPMPHLQHLQLQQLSQSPAAVVDMDEEENEAAPQLAAESALNLNVESLNAEEAFQQESHVGHGRGKKNAGKNTKTFVHEIDGHRIIETTEPSNSTHLDTDDFEPVPEDEDDQSDKSYEGRDDDVFHRKPANGANGVGFVDQAALWMQNRLEMDIPRDERKPKKEIPQKPATRSDGRKRGGRKSNELKSLIQMDFGPAENSRRAQDMLPSLIKTVTLKESAKNLRNTTERRSNSAAGGSITPSAKGKDTRSLRHRDSADKSKECRACGNVLDEKKTEKHRGYCNELCSRISRSPMNTEGEDEETMSERTEQTPEPTNRKKESSSTPNSGSKRRSTAKDEVKEEPMEEVSTTPKRRGRGKKEEEMIVPKKEIVTPKKEEKKKEEKKVVKKEPEEEEMPLEKQKSPVMKKRAGQEKKSEEPPAKTRKIESLPPPPAAPAACESPALVAALTAPPTYLQQLQPPPMQQQLLQQVRLPAAVAEVGPLPVVAAAAVPAAAAAPAAPTSFEMDSVTCRQLSVEQVRAWVERITGKPEIAQQFASEDVDGETLLTLKYNDLRDDLKLSLGMAKKVYSAIEEICKRRPIGSDE